ncbi:MAG: MoaD/ThiS family protein [Anaerolineae bacterium]
METAKLKYHKQEWELPAGISVREAIERAGLDPQHVHALRNKRLVDEESVLDPGDEIRLVNAISGG